MSSGPTDDDQRKVVGLMLEMQRRLSPEEREKMDAAFNRFAEGQFDRMTRAMETIGALKLVHREGSGDRTGFCVECGNVMPCTTRKLIAPLTGEE